MNPKTFTAQNITGCNPIQFMWRDGALVDVRVTIEVNYGELGMTHEVSIWDDLSQAQKDKAKAVYLFIKSKVEQVFLGE